MVFFYVIFSFKYINFHETLKLFYVQYGTMRRHRFDVRILIKMKVKDIKIKLMKVIIFKK